MSRSACTAVLAASLILAACGDQTTTPTSVRVAPGTILESRSSPPPPPTPNVTSILYDADASGAALLTRSDDFNGSTSATYTAVNNITSHIGADGGWQLYLGSQSARTVRLTLASQGIPVPDGSYSSNVEVYTGCYNAANAQVSLLTMAVGAVNGNCSFGVDFSSGQTKHKLVMSPNWTGTGRAMVTCNSAAGTSCTNWTIAVNTGVANAGVANLFHYAKNGSLVLDGVYHNSYSVNVVQ